MKKIEKIKDAPVILQDMFEAPRPASPQKLERVKSPQFAPPAERVKSPHFVPPEPVKPNEGFKAPEPAVNPVIPANEAPKPAMMVKKKKNPLTGKYEVVD